MTECEKSMMIPRACTPSKSSLSDCEYLTNTSQQMLGVLFLPLSTPSHKGAKHNHNQNTLAPISPRKVEIPLSLSRWVSQLSQVKPIIIFST
jgi:hypothetical protein